MQFLVLLCLGFGTSMSSFAQKVLLDEPIQAGELTLFPAVDDPNEYYYLLDRVRLAQQNGRAPQFSFLRYVQEEAAAENKAEGSGGGIVHALLELYLPTNAIEDAERALQRIHPNANIKGQLLYENGTISLKSSFQQEDGNLVDRVIGFGKAAIMANQKMAMSIRLTKQGSKILWESFNTPTPDMSVSFEMDISGYRSPKQVLIEADFDQIYQHHTVESAAVTPVFAAEVKAAFDDLVKSGAIKVTQIGEDEHLEKALESAYNKLIHMMFDPTGGTGAPDLGQLSDQQGGKSILDRATEMLSTEREEVRAQNERIEDLNQKDKETYLELLQVSDDLLANLSKELGYVGPGGRGFEKSEEREKEDLPTFAAAASYQMKSSRQRGVFKIDLNKYTADKLSFRFDHNFGAVKEECPDCFREASLEQEMFKQREINAYLDGSNARDFDKYINFVNLILRKRHGNGKTTTKELKIDASNFAQQGNQFKLLYGWNGDQNPSQWYNYEYQVKWNFFGGHQLETDWIKSNDGAIPLVAGFRRKLIDIEADPDIMEEKAVRSAEVKIYYQMGAKEYVKEELLNFGKDEYSKQIEVILPLGSNDFQYEVTWHVRGRGQKVVKKTPSKSAILFLDDIL